MNRFARLLWVMLAASLMMPAFAVASATGAGAFQSGVRSDTQYGSYKMYPNFFYKQDTTAPKDTYDKHFVAYISVPEWTPSGTVWRRRQVKADAGSGDLNTTNTCTTNKGPLPNGRYSNQFMNKTWGHSTVRGYVWYLGNKQCPTGKWRTELFIHSQGVSGTADGITNGCIEIGQGARGTLAFYNRVAYDAGNGRTTVSNA